jgi:hypothetical protein
LCPLGNYTYFVFEDFGSHIYRAKIIIIIIIDIRKNLSALIEINRDRRKVKNIKRTRLFKKYNIEKEEKLDQLTEELKQNVSAKTQRLSRYRKRQNQYYQNKLFRTDCKKCYISLLLLFYIFVLLLLLLLLLAATELSLDGCSPYTSIAKINNNIHKQNNTKHSNYKHTH